MGELIRRWASWCRRAAGGADRAGAQGVRGERLPVLVGDRQATELDEEVVPIRVPRPVGCGCSRLCRGSRSPSGARRKGGSCRSRASCTRIASISAPAASCRRRTTAICAVPKSAVGEGNGTPQTGYLPYGGDRMLVVILSKAMLLAKDTEIAEPTILSRLANRDRRTVTPPTCGSRAGPGRSNNFSRGPSLLQYDGQPIVSYSAAQANNTQESVP